MDLDAIYEEIDNCQKLPVLVEGPNDQKSLEKLGFNKIVQLDKPLFQMVELLEGEEEIVLLTDLDAHGRKLYKYFYNELTKRGVKVNNRLRLLLFETQLSQIEGLFSYLQRQDPCTSS